MRRGSLLVLFLTVFIDLLGFGIVLPLLPFYARHYGATATTVGLVVGVYSFMQFLFAPVWGRLSDRIGRRPVLLISLSGSVAGYAIFALATTLPLLFLARIIAGTAAANIGTAQAYIADSTSFANRAKGMGLIGAAFGLGFIFGPPIGGVLSSVGTAAGFHGNFLPGAAACLLSLTAFSIALFVLGESKPPDLVPRSGRPPQFDPQMWKLVFRSHELSTVLLCLFLIIFAFAGMETSVVLYGRKEFGFSPRELGYFFGLMGVVVALIQGALIGRLANAFGERRLVMAGAGLLTIGFAAVPFIVRPGWLYGVAVVVAAGQALSYPSLTSLVTKNAPEGQHGSILGVSSSLGSLSRMTGPVVAGILYDVFFASGPFFAAALLSSVALLAIARMHSREWRAAAVRGVDR